jgi:uncharacterized protein (UPF0332 family)
MDKISWCREQNKGIKLIEPNDNLSDAYIKEANDTLKEIQEGAKWSTIMSYYACYNAFYALLMKVGIKCEIHDCTIELIKMVPEFSDEDYQFFVSLKIKRIDVQYYLKKVVLDSLVDVKKFVLKCDQIRNTIDVKKMRGKIEDAEI